MVFYMQEREWSPQVPLSSLSPVYIHNKRPNSFVCKGVPGRS
jgi:hypothetical protein